MKEKKSLGDKLLKALGIAVLAGIGITTIQAISEGNIDNELKIDPNMIDLEEWELNIF